MFLSAYFALGQAFVLLSNCILSALATEAFSGPGAGVLSMSNGTVCPAVLHALSIGLTAVASTLVGDIVRDVCPIESDHSRGGPSEHLCMKNRASRVD